MFRALAAGNPGIATEEVQRMKSAESGIEMAGERSAACQLNTENALRRGVCSARRIFYALLLRPHSMRLSSCSDFLALYSYFLSFWTDLKASMQPLQLMVGLGLV